MKLVEIYDVCCTAMKNKKLSLESEIKSTHVSIQETTKLQVTDCVFVYHG